MTVCPTDNSETILYLGYYGPPNSDPEERAFAPAARDKMDYIISVVNRLGLSVQVVSASHTVGSEGCPGRTIALDDRNSLRLFRTYGYGNVFKRLARGIRMRTAVLAHLLWRTRPGENLIVYHSLGYASIVSFARMLRRFRLILEVEELYSDVSGKPAHRRREARVFRRADAFILPVERLSEMVNPENKPYAVVHGTYRSEPRCGGRFSDGRIHVVYAGTFDPRKGGALAAVAAAEYLDSRYHVHIIGFGDEDEKRLLLRTVDEVAERTDCRLTYDGLLLGDEYSRFLQSCDVGLSTQSPGAAFNETSFPSKVLSYMSNGLRVVSIRLRVLEESGVGDMVYYYETDTPQAIAEAVLSIEWSEPYGSQLRITALDEQFAQQMEVVLSK